MPGDDPSLNQNAALAEFTALREEILARQGHQHTMMALNLTISGAVFSFALTQSTRVLALLVVPFTAFMIGGRYIAQDYGIEEIGKYIGGDLSRRVTGGLGWEGYITQNRTQNRRQLFFGLDPLFIAFPGVACAALLFCAGPVWTSLVHFPLKGALLIIAWILGVFLTAVSLRNIWQIRRHFILAGWRRGSGGSGAPQQAAALQHRPGK